ncbi:MAG: family NAD(P)-dependent oxidoreductase [Candidatus Saccharibacteria bacterium]|nr:family NAD(P)-dependent oxidoreductase [Candidatus Saccharibacteria bacterium]
MIDMNKKALIVITGVKFSEVKRDFSARDYITYIEHDNKKYKMNAAAGVVRQLINDYEIICTGYSELDGDILASAFGLSKDRFFTTNLLNKVETDEFVEAVADLKTDLNISVHLVHYGGASDTKTKLPNDSLLAHTWDLKAEALPALIENNCVTLINILQSMKKHEIFEGQSISKVLFISAAAAVRAKQMLGLDVAQKGAGHGLIRTIALDLTPENIFVTEIMPGSTDTGFFDNDYSLDTAVEVTKRLGYENTRDTYPVFTAEQIGDAAKYTLDANCNVRELVLLPYGQFPHLGA